MVLVVVVLDVVVIVVSSRITPFLVLLRLLSYNFFVFCSSFLASTTIMVMRIIAIKKMMIRVTTGDNSDCTDDNTENEAGGGIGRSIYKAVSLSAELRRFPQCCVARCVEHWFHFTEKFEASCHEEVCLRTCFPFVHSARTLEPKNHKPRLWTLVLTLVRACTPPSSSRVLFPAARAAMNIVFVPFASR